MQLVSPEGSLRLGAKSPVLRLLGVTPGDLWPRTVIEDSGE